MNNKCRKVVTFTLFYRNCIDLFSHVQILRMQMHKNHKSWNVISKHTLRLQLVQILKEWLKSLLYNTCIQIQDIVSIMFFFISRCDKGISFTCILNHFLNHRYHPFYFFFLRKYKLKNFLDFIHSKSYKKYSWYIC